MRTIKPSPLNSIYFYPMEGERGIVAPLNYMEDPRVYWQPVPKQRHVPLCFYTEREGLSLAIRLINARTGTAEGYLNSIDVIPTGQGLIHYFNNFSESFSGKQILRLEGELGGETLMLGIAFIDNLPLSVLVERCTLLTAQFSGVQHYAIPSINSKPITYFAWVPGAVKLSEAEVEEEYNTFRDQAWREHVVYKRYVVGHKVKIDNAPSWILDTLHAFTSMKRLYLNDSIRVALSSSGRITVSPASNINRLTGGFTLLEADANMDTGDGVMQEDGTYASVLPLMVSTDEATDRKDYTVWVPNKALVFKSYKDSIYHPNRGTVIGFNRPLSSLSVTNVSGPISLTNLNITDAVSTTVGKRLVGLGVRVEDSNTLHTDIEYGSPTFMKRRFDGPSIIGRFTVTAAPQMLPPIGTGSMYGAISSTSCTITVKQFSTSYYTVFQSFLEVAQTFPISVPLIGNSRFYWWSDDFSGAPQQRRTSIEALGGGFSVTNASIRPVHLTSALAEAAILENGGPGANQAKNWQGSWVMLNGVVGGYNAEWVPEWGTHGVRVYGSGAPGVPVKARTVCAVSSIPWADLWRRKHVFVQLINRGSEKVQIRTSALSANYYNSVTLSPYSSTTMKATLNLSSASQTLAINLTIAMDADSATNTFNVVVGNIIVTGDNNAYGSAQVPTTWLSYSDSCVSIGVLDPKSENPRYRNAITSENIKRISTAFRADYEGEEHDMFTVTSVYMVGLDE